MPTADSTVPPAILATGPDETATATVVRRAHWAFAGVVVLYLILAVRLIALLPLWGAVQDEPLHFGYAKYLAVHGSLPVIAPTEGADLRFYYTTPSAGDAAHHPPGHYFLTSVALRLFSGASMAVQNYAARGVSLLLGLTGLLLVFAALRRLFPARPLLAAGVAALVAMFPHYLFISAVVHPEAYGAAAASAALWALAVYRGRERWSQALVVGLCLGLLALDKMTMLPFCVAGAATMVVLGRRAGLPWRTCLLHLVLLGGMAFAVCGWWFVRNWLVYGQFMPSTDIMLGTTRHTRLFLKDGSQDMIAFLFIPQGQVRYRLALMGAFRYFWCPGDWLPPVVRPLMYALGGLVWLVAPVGLIRGWRARQQALRELGAPFVLPFLGALGLLFAMYIRWTVLVAIQAHAEMGRWLMPLAGSLGLMWALAAQALVGERRVVAVAFAVAGFLLVWDVLAMWHIGAVLIPMHAGGYPGV